jgi:hypothetical protein
MAKTTTKMTDVVATIVDALTPLESTQRQRTIQAALTLLGETFVPPATGKTGADPSKGASHEGISGNIEGLSKQATAWMKKYSISKEKLDEVFHVTENAAEVIASKMPGKKRGEQTVNAYVLQGISSYLLSGEPNFDDQSARQLCEQVGCYDYSNHTKYLASKGNLFTGSKKGGWRLTNPGLKHGSDLINEVTKTQD